MELAEYSSLIQLENEYTSSLLSLNHIDEMINELIEILLKENDELRKVDIPRHYDGKRNLLKGLLTVREPNPLNLAFLEKLDSLLQTERKEKGIVEVKQLGTVSDIVPDNPFNHSDQFILWQGDLTQLKADVIVNAANKYMLGCFQPSHACIDNAIHSAAGPQLREDCKTIISIQGGLEETGGAKITRGYNLPAKFVLYTVGPIVSKGTELTEKPKSELATCYISCLDLANEIEEIKTIAFCAISTGVFGFPKSEAASIAVRTVDEWLNTHPNHFEKIIFNVFSIDDYNEYLKTFQRQDFSKGGHLK
ncbi:protein-ADP-ribose hydrolase [Bacillus sp. JJ1609]|uniref:protein-ADP-ribose hydrolase n=1 Tax=Bacillus sp. JJ1609 TaxID=3122977 RepID=UPI002FFE0DD6